ncbi:unnamed protein product, partial [Ascophyllum nodosum]
TTASATSTATVTTTTTARAAPSSSATTPTPAGAKASEPALTPIAPYGDESSSFPNLFTADRSDDVYADDLLQDALDSDGDAHAEGFKSHEPEASGGAAGFPARNEAGDEQDAGEEGRQVMASNKGGSKRKKGDRKRAREGEIESEAQKQKASRDRNREHARNTRIRKKQYVENLKTQIGELLQMKARAERNTLLVSSKASTERATRRQMVLNMFYLRASEDLSRRSWATILDESFTCIAPLTPYRHFPSSEVREDHRFITGIDGMIQDTASLAVFIQSICRRSQNPTGQKVNYQFYTSPEDTVVGSDSLMCRWLMKTENAAECGAQCEVCSQGMLRAKFARDHRIKRLEFVFDVMGFMQQLQRAMGGGCFRVTPNTLESAMQASRQARLVCSSEPPYWIVHANEAWTALTGHSAEQAKLFPLNFFNGPAGSAEVNNVGDLDVLVKTCVGTNLKRAAMADVRIATRNMNRLSVSVLCYPLGTRDGNTAHVLLVMEEVPICPALPQPGQSVGGRE